MLYARLSAAVVTASFLVTLSASVSVAQSSGGATDSAAPQSAAPAAAASPIATSSPVGQLLPGGTTVTVGLQEPLSSATAKVDDQVAIVVKKPVIVNGYLFIEQGANGYATVTDVEHSGGNGSGGKLSMSIDWVYAVDGGKIKLSQTNHAADTADSKGASSTATIATYLLLGPLGLFAHNFVHGREATIDKKQSFVVFVDHDVNLVAKPAAPFAESTPR